MLNAFRRLFYSTHSQWSGLQNIEHMDSQINMRRSLPSPLLRLVMFRVRNFSCLLS